ncbi:Na+/H+ antiporter subunit A [Phytohabitans suffuscus]|uniref:Na+/H+ antiporter subunit A n=1 Tax=Phytohabitans suffuscus TaxID=624315 RepID=A0A6F8YUN3_9ACTN|nr:Na+/H+ antiporter subunit A [Phytohabitans suffuscus]BCB89648.1 Na+/H+ antiporter subunit A [Phytohabitans suffuscus]
MLILLLAHAALAVAAPALVRWLGPRAFYALAAAPLAAAGWAIVHTGQVVDGGAVESRYSWVGPVGLTLSLRMDALAWLMVLLVGGIGALVLVYCGRYFDPAEPGLGLFAGVFVAFAGTMLGLVVSDDLLLLYVFWELTTVCSYLLIGHSTASRPSRRAALQALVVTTAGGLAMLVGFVMLGVHAGSYRWSQVADALPGGWYLATAVVLILLGALSKSAIFPFSFWLPAAMAAPTPVSAYLHAAAMVKAGVFLVAQLAPAITVSGAPAATTWRVVVFVGGVATMLYGGWVALRQHDLKLLLAYGTVSQLGLLTAVLGAGGRDAAVAGAAMLLAHALFKAALFLVVGVVDRATGTRDLRRLSGLGRRAPALAVAAGLAAASMAGLPPLIGFVGKEAVFASLFDQGLTGRVVLAGVVAGSVLTVAYTLRFLWGAFATKVAGSGVAVAGGAAPGVDRTVVRALLPAPMLLAVTGLVAGLAAPAVDRLLAPYADRFRVTGPVYHLALWHGPGVALGLSVLVLGLGAALFRAGTFGADRGQARTVGGSAGAVYDRLMVAVDRMAVEVTGATQRGSLPFYLGVTLLVLIALVGTVLAVGRPFGEPVELWQAPLHALPVAVLVTAAVFAAQVRQRLTAVILVGITGYAVAGLFLLYGAPDLALTQFLVETVTMVMLVLVLRRLPSHFSERPQRWTRWIRISIGVAVGTAMAAMAYVAVGARNATPISVDFPDLAVSYGGGRNIVNVILVDIRAWDTMGEISVLVAVATGVASLIFRRAQRLHRRGPGEVPSEPPDGGSVWLMAGHTVEAGRRSTMLEVVTRLLFHPIVLLSVYLLFTGHNSPGGGFTGGLVAALALVVRYLAGGRHELAIAAPVNAGAVLGAGLFVAVGTGVGAMVLGGQVLQSAVLDVHLPLVGHIHLVTSTLFDVGVYLIVVGLVLDVLRSLGAEVDRHQDADREAERTKEPV